MHCHQPSTCSHLSKRRSYGLDLFHHLSAIHHTTVCFLRVPYSAKWCDWKFATQVQTSGVWAASWKGASKFEGKWERWPFRHRSRCCWLGQGAESGRECWIRHRKQGKSTIYFSARVTIAQFSKPLLSLESIWRLKSLLTYKHCAPQLLLSIWCPSHVQFLDSVDKKHECNT